VASKLTYHLFWAYLLWFSYPFWVLDSFQLLLLLIVFGLQVHPLAGFAVIFTFVLIAAWIICIYPGSYLYSFPKGMLI
jgi:hypothetical protein